MWYQRKANKFGAESKIYGGRAYHSKLEAQYAQTLDLLKKAKEIKEWTPQYKLSLDVNGHHIANYYADFLVIDKYGEEQIHEVKGYSTDTFQLKWKLCEALFGDKYKLILIKQ